LVDVVSGDVLIVSSVVSWNETMDLERGQLGKMVDEPGAAEYAQADQYMENFCFCCAGFDEGTKVQGHICLSFIKTLVVE